MKLPFWLGYVRLHFACDFTNPYQPLLEDVQELRLLTEIIIIARVRISAMKNSKKFTKLNSVYLVKLFEYL